MIYEAWKDADRMQQIHDAFMRADYHTLRYWANGLRNARDNFNHEIRWTPARQVALQLAMDTSKLLDIIGKQRVLDAVRSYHD
jgi:hypothetical protein